MTTWRWNDLDERERRIARMAAVDGMKDFAIAKEEGVSESRVTQILSTIYRILGTRGRIHLAFEIGRHESNGKAMRN